MPNSWVPRPPGVTQRPPPHPPDGRSDPAAARPTGRRSTGPSTYPVGTVLGYPNAVTVFRTSPPPASPFLLSVSASTSLRNRPEQRPYPQGASPQLPLPGTQLKAAKGGRRSKDQRPAAAVRVRRPWRRQRARSQPRACAHSHAARTQNQSRSSYALRLHNVVPPTACAPVGKSSACSRPLARQPASRRVGKGSEQRSLRRAGGGGDGDLGGGGGGYNRDGCALALSASWRLLRVDKRRERERARGRGGDDDG